MAVVIGTNSGFVTSTPSADPGGGSLTIDNTSKVTHDTSPATASKITEVGWWCDDATEASNFEIGIYAADGAVVPGEAGTLLHVERTNAKGTGAGWKSVAVDWEIDPNTSYWIGVQLDNTSTTTTTDAATSGFTGYDSLSIESTLPDPFGGGALADSDGAIAFYAKWEAGAATGTNSYINIGDTFKKAEELYVNIGDTWKRITTQYINKGDVWKKIF